MLKNQEKCSIMNHTNVKYKITYSIVIKSFILICEKNKLRKRVIQ